MYKNSKCIEKYVRKTNKILEGKKDKILKIFKKKKFAKENMSPTNFTVLGEGA